MGFEGTENLRILKEAEDIADEIWDEIIKWDYFAKNTVGKQLVKSADSVGANIAESQGRFMPGDVIHFLHISRGSLQEAKFWLRRSTRRKLMSEDKYKYFQDKYDNLLPQLNAYTTTQKQRKKKT
ncbi:four helix bundle protein [candidate division WOR-3 bacterium]|nr:four helix bundle protein [candidate division WOR-3 bacterium]